ARGELELGWSGGEKINNESEVNSFIYLLVANQIILCGCIFFEERLVRCVSLLKLGINGCFVPGADF
ncbi:hypothetical protein, partial [Serratia marcescens]|uniref:hypothetical protein n=1 Tax=Serratia marcescens TaxID=615 RepID=UPI003B860F9F